MTFEPTANDEVQEVGEDLVAALEGEAFGSAATRSPSSR